MILSGSYNHQLDAKGRLRIPYKFKPILGADCYLTRCSNGSLMILSEEQFDKFIQGFNFNDISESAEAKVVKAILGMTVKVEEDAQGRFVLPQNLRQIAGITKNIVFVGVGNRVELWDEEKWNKYNNIDAAAFDALLLAAKEDKKNGRV